MFGRGPRKSDSAKYYDVLGVSKNTGEDEIKKAYRKAAMKKHLDKERFEKWKCCSFVIDASEVISERDRCPQCKAQKVTQEKKVHVEKGIWHGLKIIFAGQADEALDTIIGDIDFVLQVEDHPRFKREDDDLHIDHSLNLTEALCGF
ncbi:hypothetical protein RIF29_38633 [Crotalaria pallida]|uniref:J domain-containing protein n=1 Tax=Crotalaria pallida TaxID=3830 RepID=A0AAN9E1I4_CROPI